MHDWVKMVSRSLSEKLGLADLQAQEELPHKWRERWIESATDRGRVRWSVRQSEEAVERDRCGKDIENFYKKKKRNLAV